jgi:hypothetical protein
LQRAGRGGLLLHARQDELGGLAVDLFDDLFDQLGLAGEVAWTASAEG